ncbi:hypothetical protein N2152v2_007905 [Parachlorella kessleri]
MTRVYVCGGGVIGASVAYYLAQRGVKPVILEATSPACSASGKAGGFLALDWCDSSPVGPLARNSFQLHAELAETLGIDCGYRRVKTHSLSVRPGAGKRASRTATALPDWVDQENVAQATVIGNEESTAQVHPELFTKALIHKVQEAGGELRLARFVGLETGSGKVTGVRIVDQGTLEETLLPADVVVLAMGAWSRHARAVLPQLPDVSGMKVHSIVLADSQGATTADALFLAYRGPGGKSLEPEVYPRPNGQVYVCGVAEEDAVVPSSAADVTPREDAIDALQGELGKAELLQQQACFLPCTDDGLPILGRVPGVEGAFIATGHSCWGILNAPATGLAMAELILDGECSSLDISAFDPARFAGVKARRR